MFGRAYALLGPPLDMPLVPITYSCAQHAGSCMSMTYAFITNTFLCHSNKLTDYNMRRPGDRYQRFHSVLAHSVTQQNKHATIDNKSQPV